MTSTVKFDRWQNTAGDTIYDGTNGGLPISGNAIINGDFGVWQRGTSFSLSPTAYHYTSDRWSALAWSGATVSVSRQAFTPGDIEAIGYGDAEYFFRYSTTDSSTGHYIRQHIEDVRTFAGQNVTISFWAKNSVSSSLTVELNQQFGSGGSSVANNFVSGLSVGTSWQRFTVPITLASVSGKTIGSSNYLQFIIRNPAGNSTLDVWGVQLEAGPVATPFKLAGGGSKAAELALCQRYYQKSTNYDVAPNAGGGLYFQAGRSYPVNAGTSMAHYTFPTEMRTSPTVRTWSPNNGAAGYAWSEVTQSNVGGGSFGCSSSPKFLANTSNPRVSGIFSELYWFTFDASAEL